MKQRAANVGDYVLVRWGNEDRAQVASVNALSKLTGSSNALVSYREMADTLLGYNGITSDPEFGDEMVRDAIKQYINEIYKAILFFQTHYTEPTWLRFEDNFV